MYNPPEVGQDLSDEEFRLLVLEQFQDIAQAFRATLPKPYNAPPTKPFEGLIVIADGTNWNPGNGVGYYGYYDGSWLFLG